MFAYEIFDNYYIEYYGTHPNHSYVAIIYCRDSTRKKNVGRIVFYPDDMTRNSDNYDNAAITIYLPVSRFNDIINILRYEKPLALAFNGERGYINTSQEEKVGEQEGV